MRNELYGYANLLSGHGPTLEQLYWILPAAILLCLVYSHIKNAAGTTRRDFDIDN